MTTVTRVTPIEFAARLKDSGQGTYDSCVHVDVLLRGQNVGFLNLTLGQWDQLRDDTRDSWLVTSTQKKKGGT